MEDREAVWWVLILFGILIIGAFGVGLVTASVPAGNKGVQDTFGNVSEQVLEPGFYLKAPWTSIVPVSVKTQLFDDKDANGASKDLQDVTTNIAVNYHVDGMHVKDVYKTIGLDYSDIVMYPAIQETMKAVTAKFNATELIGERELVRQNIEDLLISKLKPYNIVVEKVAITNFNFSEQFNNAIEGKVTASQDAEKEQNILLQYQIRAQQKIAQAEGDANAVRIAADAQAYALDVVNQQLQKNQQLVQWQAVKQWDGRLPVVTSGAIPLINITSPRADVNG